MKIDFDENQKAIIDKDDLLQAVSWFYYSEIEPVSEEDIKEAKQNLFRVAGLIE